MSAPRKNRPKRTQSIPMAAVRFASLTMPVVVLLAMLPSAVVAKQARLLAGTFGAATSTVVDPYPVERAGSVAVDESTHDFYVADPDNYRVEKFDASGHFLFMFGKGVDLTTGGDVCPEAPLDICQAGAQSSSPGGFSGFRLVLAVDNSPGGKGDVYVGDGAFQSDGMVSKFDPEGRLVGGYATGGRLGSAPAATGAGTLTAGSMIVTGVSGATGVLLPGAEISGAGIPAATTITYFNSENHRLVLSKPASASASGVSLATAPLPFSEIEGLAVDPSSGNVWLLAQGRLMLEFGPEAAYITSWIAPDEAQGGIAIDSKDNVYIGGDGIGEGGVVKLSPAGILLGEDVVEYEGAATPQVPFTRIEALVVDPSSDELYAGVERIPKEGPSEFRVNRYDSSCHPRIGDVSRENLACVPAATIGSGFITSSIEGLTIDPSSAAHTVYVSEHKNFEAGKVAASQVLAFSEETVPDVTTTPPADPAQASVTLTGTVNPSGFELNEGATGCRFEWGETAVYGHEVACAQTAAQVGMGESPVEVSAQITGLQAGHTYHYRLVGSNTNDVNGLVDQPSFGGDVTFGPPVIEGASATDVAASEATLQVEIDPRAVNTRVRVEYVTQEQFDIDGFSQALSSPVRNIPATGVMQPPSFKLTALVPHTVYRYRAVAESVLAEGLEAVVGTELAFTTEVAGSSAQLPDGRAWELVSPPEKYGSRIEAIFETGVVQAAADGEAISYFANAPTEPEPQASGVSGGVQILSTRTPGGWASQDLVPPHAESTGVPVGPGNEYRAFSENLEYSFVNPFGPFDAAISPEASEQSAFRRTDYLNGDPAQQCVAKTTSCYRPLVTGVEGFANVPSGTEFGVGTRLLKGPGFLYATPDGSRAIIESGVALTGTPITGASPALYEWDAAAPAAEQLRLVSVLPGTGEQPVKEAFLGYESQNMRNALSADGSRVVFTEGGHVGGGGSIKRLFLRDVSRSETVQVDRHEAGCSKCESGEGHFQLASSDGSRVLFTDTRRLTADSGAVPGQKLDLYQCQIVESEATGELECALTDLTPKTTGGQSADVLGTIIGASQDAANVYFVANGVLSEEQNAHDEHAASGECITNAPASKMCNLYQSDNGRVSFIARLSAADNHDWGSFSLRGMPARVSPNGLWFAFMSQRSLTGYDNRDVATGEPAAEVYLYDAATDRILCASCDPAGARPHAIEYKMLQNETIDGGDAVWSGGLVAANLPGWIGNESTGQVARRQPRYLSDSGRVFFNSGDALIPEDANGTQDVYEFELPGTGDCSQASQRFAANNGGCVSLISSGSSAQESAFLDASESGDDVFFLTSQRLVARDIDSAYDVYDARVDGGEPPIVKPVECVGDACQTPVVPPVDQAPGSLTFNGPGNIQQPTPKQTSSKTKHKQKPHKKKPRKRSHGRTGPKHGGHK